MSLNIELLEYSFKQIEDRGLDFAAEFYAKLFANYPEVQPLFKNAELEAQGKKLFASLALVVDNLRQPEVLSQALKGLGTRHIKYGVLPKHYPMVGNIIIK
jgi:hemoglobin-like flavoprotein